MKDKLHSCIEDKNSDCVPIWFMRQAGRYLPEFRKIRKKNPNFINLCLNTKLIKDITLQPLSRFDLDAAIIFSDILMIPYGLGQNVEFKKGFGPVLKDINFNEIINKDTFDPKNKFFSARRSIHNKERDYGRNISIIMIN